MNGLEMLVGADSRMFVGSPTLKRWANTPFVVPAHTEELAKGFDLWRVAGRLMLDTRFR